MNLGSVEGVVDTVGSSPVYIDPLWRVRVELTDLERALLRCWPVRRLAHIAHAGAAATCTTQTYSRLEHSLGLLALVAHFAPEDHTARAAALLHDVGHLPLSHTFEGVAGLDHHVLGACRVRALADVLADHGVDVQHVLDTDDGRRASVLTARRGVLKLDHLDSFVRGGVAHARTRESPAQILARTTVVDGGCVSSDEVTSAHLVALIVAEARWQCSPLNVLVTGVVRQLATTLLDHASPGRRDGIAEMCDDEFWALVLTDPATARTARALRRDPTSWRVTPLRSQRADHALATGERTGPREIVHTVERLYVDLPLCDGTPLPVERLDGLPTLPWSCTIHPPTSGQR